jgi:hypothetical protein
MLVVGSWVAASDSTTGNRASTRSCSKARATQELWLYASYRIMCVVSGLTAITRR